MRQRASARASSGSTRGAPGSHRFRAIELREAEPPQRRPTTLSSSPSHSAMLATYFATSGQVAPEHASTFLARNRRMRS